LAEHTKNWGRREDLYLSGFTMKSLLARVFFKNAFLKKILETLLTKKQRNKKAWKFAIMRRTYGTLDD